MSSYIKITDPELLDHIVAQFKEALSQYKCSDASLSLTYPIAQTKERAQVIVGAKAFIKITALVQHFSKEVAWHATAYRTDDPRVYYIDDVIVYPQEVTGATVNTDQEEYQKWLYSLDEEVFNNLRAQGHSHVNMGVSPSSVDTTHQEQILAQLDDDMFYIFMIWNKSFDSYFKIYDAKENLIFFDSDIDVTVEGFDSSMADFVDDAESLVKSKSYSKSKSKSNYTKGTDDSSRDYTYYPYGAYSYLRDDYMGGAQ